MLGKRQTINIPPGVNKDDDSFTSFIYTDANLIRFYQGLPETVGGWVSVPFGNNQVLTGVPRTIFTYVDSNNLEHVLIGTNTRLYSYEQGQLFNITPLVTGTTAIANSLSTNFETLGANAMSVTLNSTVVTVTYATLVEATLQQGDVVNIAGVVANIGGIPFADINGQQSIFDITPTTFSFSVAVAASSNATGGTGATVATRVITVAQLAHGFLNGDRIKITMATGFGGFAAGDLNIENVIRVINANSYAYYLDQTNNFATSHVAGGGGAGTLVQGQIAGGQCAIEANYGYGGGLYGEGAYGTAKSFGGAYLIPLIWSFDTYNNTVVMTQGQQTGLYDWIGDVNVAPTLVTNAPAAINYVFTAKAEGQIVTFGAGGILNAVQTSDANNSTNWTVGPGSIAFDVDVVGGGQLIAAAYVKKQYLLFTQSQVYKMYSIRVSPYWIVELVTDIDGIIGPNALVVLPDKVIWRGQNDWYVYNGAILYQAPTNTLRHWTADNLNVENAYLTFMMHNAEFKEAWTFMPFGNTEEPNTYVIWNYEEGTWTNGILTRTAAEQINNLSRELYMASGTCDGTTIPPTLFQHETNYTNDGASLIGSLTTNYTVIDEGDYSQCISAIIPSNYVLPIGTPAVGNLLYTITVNVKEYDGIQHPIMFGPYKIYDNTTKVDTRINGRQRQYVYNFATTATFPMSTGFRIQKTYEMNKPFTVR